MISLLLGVSALAALSSRALPVLESRQSITALSTSQITTFRPYTHYASTAYCNPSTTLTWTCGANCNANPTFQPVASGGDGDATQFWYVGFDPNLNTVIVGHQGTDTSKIMPVLTDAGIIGEKLDPTLFPGISSDVTVHSGFAATHERSAPGVLAGVKAAIAKYNANHVTIVGHSLGAAIALLDAVYLPLHISGVTFKTIGYGMPRVGNDDFANYVDGHVTNLNHVNNKKDPVPILPGRFLGYHHPSGEIHITESNAWESCPGQDNTNALCEIGAVPNIFDSDESDHSGPYDGISMGC